MLLGALAQSIPDIDSVASCWLSTPADLLAHRGFTHSILFIVLLTPLLALASARVFRKNNIGIAAWMLLWGVELFMHLFLDIFNVYGTGLFEPFSHYRVSLNTFFVVDPLFSIWPVIAFVLLLLLKKSNLKRRLIIRVALTLSATYMAYSVCNKLIIDNRVKDSFVKQHVAAKRYFTTPTAFNNLLWYVVAESDSGYNIGYRSVLDRQDSILYSYIPKNKPLPEAAANTDNIRKLIRFSQGYYTTEQWQDTLVFSDLRFGEMTGGLIKDVHPRFTFYYYLQSGADNNTIIQRGRFAHWNKQIVQAFIKRMRGI